MNVPVKLYCRGRLEDRALPRGPHRGRREGRGHRRSARPRTGEVPSKAVVKGFEVGEDEYVVLSKDGSRPPRGMGPRRSRRRGVRGVGRDRIRCSTRRRTTSAREGRHRRLRLLRDALDQTGASGWAVHRSTTRLPRRSDPPARPRARPAHDAVRRRAGPGADIEFDAPSRKPRDREVQMAGELVSSLQEDFDPSRRKDEYRKAVLDMMNSRPPARSRGRPRRSRRRSPPTSWRRSKRASRRRCPDHSGPAP